MKATIYSKSKRIVFLSSFPEVITPIRYPLVAALFIALILIGTHPVIGMESPHFKISTSVISGGGALTESDSFLLQSTLGQSTPLMDPADPPYSDNFDAYPGFWFTVAPALGGYGFDPRELCTAAAMADALQCLILLFSLFVPIEDKAAGDISAVVLVSKAEID